MTGKTPVYSGTIKRAYDKSGKELKDEHGNPIMRVALWKFEPKENKSEDGF